MVRLRSSTPADGLRAVEIWAAAVDATHHFLAAVDREAIGNEVAEFLPYASLTLAIDADNRPVAFMLVAQGRLEALFVDPAHHGKGIGRIMMAQALAENPGLCVDVNAQNSGAWAFYRRMGFVETGRSALDGQGRPYPLVHLQYAQSGA